MIFLRHSDKYKQREGLSSKNWRETNPRSGSKWILRGIHLLDHRLSTLQSLVDLLLMQVQPPAAANAPIEENLGKLLLFGGPARILP